MRYPRLAILDLLAGRGQGVGKGRGKRKRGASRAGSHVQDGLPFDRRKKRGHDLFLCLGDEAANRTAEPKRVECFGHGGIGVDRVAVMIGAPVRSALPAVARSAEVEAPEREPGGEGGSYRMTTECFDF